MPQPKALQSRICLRQKIGLVLFGVFLFLVFLEIGLRLSGFILTSLQEHRNILSIKQKGTYRIMCIGESTTGRQYAAYLEEILNKRNIGIKFSVIDEGTAGINTTTIISQLEANLNKFTPQMVIAMMGINDGGELVFRENRNTINIASFLQSFRIYKLAKLICLHVQSRVRKIRDVYPRESMNIYSSGDLSGQTKAETQSERSPKNPDLNLKDDQEYVRLAELYFLANRFADAENSYKKAIAINPRNNKAWGLLIKLYWDYKDFSRSESTFEEAIKVNPLNEAAYFWMSGAYTVRGEYSSAEKLLRKALEIDPHCYPALSTLILVCRLQGKNADMEDLLKKYIKQDPKNEYLYGLLATFYAQTKRPLFAAACYKEASQLRMHYYNPETRDNYLKLKSVLDKRGIKLVCMEYPVRSVKPLKEMFPIRNDIVFIDNEKIFKDALKDNSYEALFKDIFAGDFGHCTEKGNRLLAKNIAEVILKAVFNK